MEKKESQKGEKEIKPVILLPSKLDTEDWVLKGTKLITNTKKQILKIYRLDSEKYNIKKKQSTKIIKYIYEVCFKNRVFFCKVIVGYKSEN